MAATATPEVGYQFPRDLSLHVRIPIHRKTFDEAVPDLRREIMGVGDVELLGGYDLARQPGGGAVDASMWRLALSAGMALPTGKHEAQPFVGDVAPTPLQLGTGTFDPLLTFTAEHRPTVRWAVDVSGAARLVVMANSDAYRPASLAEVAVGGAWRAAPGRLGLQLHAEWSHVGHAAVTGVEVPNTGRDALYMAPSVSIRLWDDSHLGITARVPVYLHVNEIQFAEDALFAARISFRTPPLFRGNP